MLSNTLFQFEESGLTEAECELVAAYLNKQSNPLPDVTIWEADRVSARDVYSYRLEIKSQSPIVSLRGITFAGKDISDLDKLSEQADQVQKYVEKNFPGQHVFIKSQSRYYITDIDKLAELKNEAINYYNKIIRPSSNPSVG
jgi:hypothetical protein